MVLGGGLTLGHRVGLRRLVLSRRVPRALYSATCGGGAAGKLDSKKTYAASLLKRAPDGGRSEAEPRANEWPAGSQNSRAVQPQH